MKLKTKIFKHAALLGLSAVVVSLPVIGQLRNSPTASAAISDASGLLVGVTYYGGHYDDQLSSWVIDNKNQCDRITNGEFSAASLQAVKSTTCNDDNGLGYIGGIPLHNTVSFAELSTDYTNPDYAALGGLAAGTKLEIRYKNRCVVAEKRDVGQGGGPVNGTHRSLDLWWQTARSLNFTNGFDTMTIRLVDSATPLTPLGSSTTCTAAAPAPSPPPPPPAAPAPTVTNPPASTSPVTQQTKPTASTSQTVSTATTNKTTAQKPAEIAPTQQPRSPSIAPPVPTDEMLTVHPLSALQIPIGGLGLLAAIVCTKYALELRSHRNTRPYKRRAAAAH